MEASEIASHVNDVILKRSNPNSVCFVHPEVYDAYRRVTGLDVLGQIYADMGFNMSLTIVTMDGICIFENDNLKLSEIVIREL